jgi:hypothetical protein
MWIQPRSRSSVTGHPQPHSLNFRASWASLIYRRFMLGFSHITWALSQVTRGDSKEKFVWGLSQQQAFNELKKRLCSSTILSLRNLQHPFEIETDYSDYVVGIVLTQHNHPMSYHSETLSDVVHKYPTPVCNPTASGDITFLGRR